MCGFRRLVYHGAVKFIEAAVSIGIPGFGCISPYLVGCLLILYGWDESRHPFWGFSFSLYEELYTLSEGALSDLFNLLGCLLVALDSFYVRAVLPLQYTPRSSRAVSLFRNTQSQLLLFNLPVHELATPHDCIVCLRLLPRSLEQSGAGGGFRAPKRASRSKGSCCVCRKLIMRPCTNCSPAHPQELKV